MATKACLICGCDQDVRHVRVDVAGLRSHQGDLCAACAAPLVVVVRAMDRHRVQPIRVADLPVMTEEQIVAIESRTTP